MTTLHAQPYNLDAVGFYFESLEDYEVRFENARDSFGLQVEEFEIQFIDGEEGDAQLFEATGVNQATVSQFFDVIEDMEDYQKAALFFLLEQGYGLDEAQDNIDDVMIQEGDLEEAAEQLFDEGDIILRHSQRPGFSIFDAILTHLIASKWVVRNDIG